MSRCTCAAGTCSSSCAFCWPPMADCPALAVAVVELDDAHVHHAPGPSESEKDAITAR